MKKKIINIFGGGCAGFSFIRRSKEVKDAIFKFYLGSENNKKDHYWGFGEINILMILMKFVLNGINGKL